MSYGLNCHLSVHLERSYAQHAPTGSVTEKASCQANMTGDDSHCWGWWIVYYLPTVKQQTSICSYTHNQLQFIQTSCVFWCILIFQARRLHFHYLHYIFLLHLISLMDVNLALHLSEKFQVLICFETLYWVFFSIQVMQVITSFFSVVIQHVYLQYRTCQSFGTFQTFCLHLDCLWDAV